MKTVPKRKTIEVTLTLWTDKLDFPGHVWDDGYVTLMRNDTHGIQECKKQNVSLDELPNAIRELLSAQGITLHR